MNIVKIFFLSICSIIYIYHFNNILYALPSVPLPLTTSVIQTAPQPTTTTPQTLTPTADISASQPILLNFTSEKQITDALNECASPSIPVFSTTGDKSKNLIYDAIFKALTPTLSSQISLETKLKIQTGLIADLVDIVLKPIDPKVYTATDISFKNVSDVNTLLTQSLVIIKQINDDISKLTSTEANIWKNKFKNIYLESSTKSSKLAAKLELQTSFLKALDNTLAITATQVKEKTDKLLYLASTFLAKDIISSLRDDYFNGISRLVSTIQNGTSDQKNILAKFFDDILKIKTIFSTTELDKINSLKQILTQSIQSSSPAQQPTAIAASIQQPQVAPVQASGQATATVQSNTAPTAPSSSTTTPQAPQQNPLTEAIKTLETAGSDAEKIINACNSAIETINKISSFSDKQILAQKIQAKINLVYDKRITLKTDMLTKLSDLLDKAQKVDVTKPFITKQKTDTLKIAILLNNAYLEEKNFSKFSTELKKICDVLTATVANYEKTKFSDGIDSLFANRKTDDVKKSGPDAITPFKELLDLLTAQTFKAKGIFSDYVQNKFSTYSKVITTLLILLKPTKAKDLKTQIDYYRPTMDALSSPDTNYEKDLFFETLAQIYSNRGNFGQSELTQLKSFFDEIMNKSGLLSLTARTKMESEWIIEITYALQITPKTEIKPYLEALIETSMNVNDFSQNITTVYPKIFSLFTSDTPVKVINTFLIKLNDLVQARDKLDKQKLLSFLLIKKLTIDKTGINEIASMLPDKQKDTLKAWVTTLKNEIQKGTKS